MNYNREDSTEKKEYKFMNSGDGSYVACVGETNKAADIVGDRYVLAILGLFGNYF